MSHTFGLSLQDFDRIMCAKYLNKMLNAREAGHEFTLTFNEYRNAMGRKYCAYTKRVMTLHEHGQPQPMDATLDRIDSAYGYIPGNVVAVTRLANGVKSTYENPKLDMSIDEGIMMFTNIDRLLKKKQNNA